MCVTRPVSQWVLAVVGCRRAGNISTCLLSLPLWTLVGELVETILSRINIADTNELAEAVESWKGASGGAALPDDPRRQKAWDLLIVKRNWDNMLHEADQVHGSRLLAMAQKESGTWLNALPVSSLGTLLYSESSRVAIAFRVGADVCIPHSCRCGGRMESRVLHVFSCKYSAGRFLGHSAMNGVIKRALQKPACLPSVLELPGLDRGDGSGPDGITVFPFMGVGVWFGIACVLILLLGYTWIGQRWKLVQLRTTPRSANAVYTLLLQRHISLSQLQSKRWECMASLLESSWRQYAAALLKWQGRPERLTDSVKTWL